MKKALILFLFVICANSHQGFAQFNGVIQKSDEFGVFGGGAYYIGDLNRLQHFNMIRPAAGIFYRHNYNYRFALKTIAHFGWIAADDARSNSTRELQRNLSFRSTIAEVSGQVEFNFFPFEIANPKFPYSPYVFGGLSVFHFNPKANLDGTWYALQPLGTEGQGIIPGRERYKRVQVAVPFGAGVKFTLFKNFGIGLEWGLRKTFTDYLDDVSKTYPDPTLLMISSGETAVTLSDRSTNADTPLVSNTGRQRGNSQNKDWYSFAGITISFKIYTKDKCYAY